MRRLNMLQAGVAAALATLSGAAASAQELVSIGLAVPHNAAYVQFYAAETLGFYKEAGVKAELTLYRGGAASQEALSAGAADIITYFGAGVATCDQQRRQGEDRRGDRSHAAWLAVPGAGELSDQEHQGSRRQEDRRRHQGRHRRHVRALGRGQRRAQRCRRFRSAAAAWCRHCAPVRSTRSRCSRDSACNSSRPVKRAR